MTVKYSYHTLISHGKYSQPYSKSVSRLNQNTLELLKLTKLPLQGLTSYAMVRALQVSNQFTQICSRCSWGLPLNESD